MSYETILYETIDDRIRRITLNRPEKLNAMSPALLSELDRAFDEFEGDVDASVLVIRGAGRAFCAGYDLGDGGGAKGDGSRSPRTAGRSGSSSRAGSACGASRSRRSRRSMATASPARPSSPATATSRSRPRTPSSVIPPAERSA
jgi:enoyl-CoA hydratase/carnithine racemase